MNYETLHLKLDGFKKKFTLQLGGFLEKINFIRGLMVDELYQKLINSN